MNKLPPVIEIDPKTTPIPEDYEGRLLARFPFEIKTKLIVHRDDKLPAPAATALTKDGDHVLVVYNPYLVYGCEKMGVEPSAVGIHEMYHYLYGHTHIDEKEREKLDNTRLLVSADCEANSYLLDLQKEPFVWPGKFQLPDKLRWYDYYKILPQEVKTPQTFSIQWMKGGKPQGDPQQVPSMCSAGLSKEEQDQIERILKKVAKSKGFDLESNPQPPRKIDDVPAVKRIERGIRSALDRILGQELDALQEKAHTLVRPHKWKEPGYPGKQRKAGPKLVFAVDCSGSTTGAQQRAYYGIVRRLLKEYKAIVLEFDDEIKHVGRKPTCNEWGGGTNFQVVQKWVRTHRSDAVIWFTDAGGSFDNKQPNDPTNIFILTDPTQHQFAEQYGRVIPYKMEDEEYVEDNPGI